MQHKINKKNLEKTLKKKNLTFLEFLQKFIQHHITKTNKQLDPQDSSVFNWIKNIYNNAQENYEANTLATLAKVLETNIEYLLKPTQTSLIDDFNLGYETYLKSRILAYLKPKTEIDDVISFSSEITALLIDNLESIKKNAGNK